MDEVCTGAETVKLVPALPSLPYSGPTPAREHDNVCVAAPEVIAANKEITEDGIAT